ncbi:MAG TPA: SdrD B-like domain-containing protein [Pyrinomonadaceae bacterium]
MKLLRAVICLAVVCALLVSPDGSMYASALTTLIATSTGAFSGPLKTATRAGVDDSTAYRAHAQRTKASLAVEAAKLAAETKETVTGGASAEPPQGATIIVDGRTLTGPFSFPQQRGGRTFLPVVGIARALGDSIKVNAGARIVEVLRRTGISADFYAELNQVRENGSVILGVSNTADIIFTPNPEELMLPVEIISALLDVSIRLDEGTRAISITRGPGHAETVRAGAGHSTFELYEAEYDYNFNMYPSAYNHNLSLRATGRIGDGRFSLITNSGTSQGRGFGPLHNGTFTYERAGGQKFTGGDFSTGTDLLFMSAAVRGVSAEIPVAGMTVKAFGGRSISGAYESQPVYTDPNLAQQQLQPNIRATGRFGYDTNVGGAYVTFGPTSRDPHNPRQLLFSTGGLYFSGPGRSGELLTGSVRYSSRRSWIQGDVGVGSFSRTEQGTTRKGGTGLAADLSGSFNVTDNLTVQGRYAHTSPNFQGLQSGSYTPTNTIAGGLTWRARDWLTTTLYASSSTRPDAPGQRDRFIAATVSVMPRPGLPSIFFSHTQSSMSQGGSGAFTLLSASRDFSRWRLFVNATRSKTLGPAFVNAQVSASLRLGESSTLQASQSFGSRGSRGGTLDWQTPSLLNKKVNFSAGVGYLRSDTSSLQTIQRLSGSINLPRQNTLQFAYLHSQQGPQLLVSLRGPLFRGGRRAEAARSASTAELNNFGAFYGRVYQDANLNGRYDPGFDRPQANVQVRVDGNRYITTDENGLFRIDGVHTGDHIVYLDLLSVRADLTLLDGQQQTVTLLPGRDSIVDFRLVRTGRLSGVVWFDTDGNGRIDENEQPLPGIRVVLGSSRDTLTDENGVFTIGDLPPGEHVVLIDEKTLPENTRSATGSLTIKVLAGSETGDIHFPVTAIPAEIKRFPAAAN